MLVALNARVSKRDGSQDTENQLQELREFCQRARWTLHREHIDRASGKTAERPRSHYKARKIIWLNLHTELQSIPQSIEWSSATHPPS
jgi:hypothetical protein